MLNFHRVDHNNGTHLSRFWVTESMSTREKTRLTLRDILQIDNCILVCRCDVSFRSYAVSRAEVAKSGKNLMFCAPNLGECRQSVLGAFVNRYNFRPTGQVWLRSHGWSFIYADKIKNKLQRYKILALPSAAIKKCKSCNSLGK